MSSAAPWWQPALGALHTSLHSYFFPVLQSQADALASASAAATGAGAGDAGTLRPDAGMSGILKKITELEQALLRLQQSEDVIVVKFAPEPEILAAVELMDKVRVHEVPRACVCKCCVCLSRCD